MEQKLNIPVLPEQQVKILDRVIEGLQTFPLQGSQAQLFTSILNAIVFVRNGIKQSTEVPKPEASVNGDSSAAAQ